MVEDPAVGVLGWSLFLPGRPPSQPPLLLIWSHVTGVAMQCQLRTTVATISLRALWAMVAFSS